MASPPTDQTCGNCSYALRLGEGTGECHYFPPQLTLKRLAKSDTDYYIAQWPPVEAGDWCAQWKLFVSTPLPASGSE